tara:strand:- start:1321 stop:1851 length:531 start_codon:yes stop_codon:yes gene_type:complete
MIERIIRILVNFLPFGKKNSLVKEIYNSKTKKYSEIILLIDAENFAYKAAFTIFVESEKKQKQLINFFGSKVSDDPKSVFYFMDEFSNDFMIEIASRHCAMMHRMKIDLALLEYSEYVQVMNHISRQKENLAEHMNDVINSKLESLDKEITQVAWEEHITDEEFLSSIKADDDLWN